MKKTAIALIFVSFLVACNEKTAYYTFHHTPITGWEKNDTLLFDIPKLKTSGNYRSDLTLRINNMFPFMRLTLIVEQTVLPLDTTRIDTLNCELIGSNGIVKGNGISYYQYSFYLTDLQLLQGDSLHIKVRHDMKREILPGISNVGIRLNRFDAN